MLLHLVTTATLGSLIDLPVSVTKTKQKTSPKENLLKSSQIPRFGYMPAAVNENTARKSTARSVSLTAVSQDFWDTTHTFNVWQRPHYELVPRCTTPLGCISVKRNEMGKQLTLFNYLPHLLNHMLKKNRSLWRLKARKHRGILFWKGKILKSKMQWYHIPQ